MSTDVQTSTSYRFSAIGRGLLTMWRATGPAVLFILINAIIQAALIYLDTQSGFSGAFLLATAVSAVSALILYAVLTAGAIEAVDGTASFGSVMGRVKKHLGSFTGWTLLQWLAIVLVSLINTVLVLLVAALTPFLPIAAMDGQGNALGSNFRALGSKWGRWLITSVILVIAGVVFYLVNAVNAFFIKGTPAALFFWLAIGVVAWWLLTAWTLVYRNARS